MKRRVVRKARRFTTRRYFDGVDDVDTDEDFDVPEICIGSAPAPAVGKRK